MFLVYDSFSFCVHAPACAPALAERVKGQCQAPSLMHLHLVRQGSSLKLGLAESARLTGQQVPRTQSLCFPAGIVAVHDELLGLSYLPRPGKFFLNKSHLELVPYVASTYICMTLQCERVYPYPCRIVGTISNTG